ncbi:MAG: hypothetical protein ACR2M1_17725 [Gemmatimonadaceae bacterium]
MPLIQSMLARGPRRGIGGGTPLAIVLAGSLSGIAVNAVAAQETQ